MNAYRRGKLFTCLVLTALLLSACQVAQIEITNHPDELTGTATQTAEAATIAPESEATMAISQPTLIGEGTVQPSPETGVPAGWQDLNDSQGGYSLAYPAEWEICQETHYSWTFCELEEDPALMGSQMRLYVSVFPNDYANSDAEVYNFIPTATIREFGELPIGESKLKEPNSPRPEYFYYTRLPDQTVAGSTAAVIENSKLWGFPSETQERVVFMVSEDNTYIIGMYYVTPNQLALFAQVLDSFRLAH